MEKNEITYNYIYRFYGYEKEPHILKPSTNLFLTLKDISNLEVFQHLPIIRIKTSNKAKTINTAKSFFESKFRLHKIPYKRLLDSLDLKMMLHLSPKTAAKMCNATNIKINPFHLPISFSGEDETDTMVITNGNLIDDDEFFKIIEISYRKIVLNRTITELSSSSYIHEITHTQLSKEKGIIKYYCNSEIIPIFLELLSLYESDTSHLELLGNIIRLNELIDHINILYTATLDGVSIDGDLTKNTVYAESILKSYHLFLEYIHGTPSLKKYILTSIQNIFNGDLQLEELLEEFEITTTSVIDGENKLKKHFISLKSI